MRIRREYQLTIKLGQKSRVFTYQQATAYETLKFIEDIKGEDFNLILWIRDFLNWICTAKRAFFERKNVSNKDFVKYVMDFENLFKIIEKTYFYGAFNKEEAQEDSETDQMPFDAYLTLLSEKLNIDPLSLLKTYTFEQISELGKGIVYVINMQSEEWRKKNEKSKLEEKMRGINKDEIAEQLAKLEDYKKRKMDTSNN